MCEAESCGNDGSDATGAVRFSRSKASGVSFSVEVVMEAEVEAAGKSGRPSNRQWVTWSSITGTARPSRILSATSEPRSRQAG